MNTAKRRTVILAVITVVMALSLTFLAPSGAILPDAQQRYLEDALPDWAKSGNAWNYTLDGTVGMLASAGLMDAILPTYDVAYLPLDIEMPGRIPIEENFTETGYEDKTILVEITEDRAYDSTFHIATVKIATPSQLRTSIKSKVSYRYPTALDFSTVTNAVVLINGDYYTKWPAGYIVRQGEVLRMKPAENIDLLLIDENSDFHIIPHTGKKSDQEDAVKALLEEHEIINGFYFGPALVIDGQIQEIPQKYSFHPHADEPRTAIGQLGPLTYVLVTVDGRRADNDGVTVPELAEYMAGLGCEQAYALDGGNSSTLVFHNEMVSIKAPGVNARDIIDVIYFATAIDN